MASNGRYWMYWLSRTGLRIMYKTFFGIEYYGRENIPADGKLIVASNHTSYWDPMVAGAASTRPLGFMARKSLFDVPGFGWLISSLYAFPVNRAGDPRDALRTFAERLDQGASVMMFPEGTRSPDGRLKEFMAGVGMISVRSMAPVLPMYIWGAFQSWPRTQKYPHLHPLRVYFGELIQPADVSGGRAKKEEQTRLNTVVENALHALEERAWRENAHLLSKEEAEALAAAQSEPKQCCCGCRAQGVTPEEEKPVTEADG